MLDPASGRLIHWGFIDKLQQCGHRVAGLGKQIFVAKFEVAILAQVGPDPAGLLDQTIPVIGGHDGVVGTPRELEHAGRDIARIAATVDTLEGFLRDMRARYPDMNASAQPLPDPSPTGTVAR